MLVVFLALAAITNVHAEADEVSDQWQSSLSAADQELQANYEVFEAELRKITSARDDATFDLSMELNLGSIEAGAKSGASCTATATVSIPGFAEVTFTATAPTCIEAGNMVIAAVRDFVAAIANAVP